MHFMRHGQSTFNVAFDTTGRDPEIEDAPLTVLGMEQVRAAARRMEKGAYDLILSSPYTRALETASIVQDIVHAPIVVEPLVGERRVYYCDIGTPASVLKPRWPSVDFAPLTAEKWWLPFDETHEALMDRVRAFKQRWAARTERILVASHWYFIHGMTGVAAENAQIIERKL